MRAPTLIALGLLAGLAVADLGTTGAAYAANMRPGGQSVGRDLNAKRDGVSSGQYVPLAEVIRKVQARYPGQLLDASLLELVPGRPVYRVLILQSDGKRIAVWVDAKTGEIRRVDG